MAGIAARGREWLYRRPSYQKWMASPLRRGLVRGQAFCQRNWFPLQILLIAAYRLSLDLLYSRVISPRYAYSGFFMNFHPLTYACTLLALLAFSPFIARLQEEGTPSANVVTVLNYLYFIPLTSYCGCCWQDMAFFLAALAYWTVLLLLQFHIPVLVLKPPGGKSAKLVFLLFTVLCVLLVMGVSGRYTGFRFTLSLWNVYDLRNEANTYSLPGMVSYALSMTGNVLAILLIYWLQRRRYLICAVLTVIFLFLFSIAGHKSLLFFLLIVLGCYFLFRPWMRRWLPVLAAPAVLLAVLEHRLARSMFLAGVIFRRTMYVPVKLSADYMAYFRDNPVTFFRNGILRRFLPFPDIYSTNIVYVIGAVNGDPDTAANCGLLGDLFTNLPFLLGLALMPLILVICFRLLDATARSLPEKLVISSCVYFAMSFSNTSWSTVLLSHGFLITCLLLYIFPKEEGLPQ